MLYILTSQKGKGKRKILKEIKRGSDKISEIKKRRMDQCKIIKFSNKMSQIGVKWSEMSKIGENLEILWELLWMEGNKVEWKPGDQ